MKTLPNLKKDLEFNRGLANLIEALKNIAVSQFRSLEQKLKSYERFLSTTDSFFEFIDTAAVDHPFFIPRNKSQMVVAITSDSGLLGGLNMQVVATAVEELEKIPGKLVIVGERGKIYARESGISFAAFSGIKDQERYFQAMQLRDYLLNKFFTDSLSYLKIVYPYPVSFTLQRVQIVEVLPYAPACRGQANSKDTSADVIIESDLGDIAEYLVYLWCGEKLYEIFGLSRLAEFGARFVHLEQSLQKLKEMDEKLQRLYFRLRHELIDRNMRELFSARLLYASSGGVNS